MSPNQILVDQLEELRKRNTELIADFTQSEQDKQRHLDANSEEKIMYQQHLMQLQDDLLAAKREEKDLAVRLEDIQKLYEITVSENTSLLAQFKGDRI